MHLFHNNKIQNKFTFDYLLHNLCDVTKHNNLLWNHHITIWNPCQHPAKCLHCYTLKNKGSLLASVVPQKPSQSILFIPQKILYSGKGFLDYSNVLHTKKNGSFKHCWLKGSLSNQTGSSMASLWNPSFGTFIFKSECILSVLILSKSALCPCFYRHQTEVNVCS